MYRYLHRVYHSETEFGSLKLSLKGFCEFVLGWRMLGWAARLALSSCHVVAECAVRQDAEVIY